MVSSIDGVIAKKDGTRFFDHIGQEQALHLTDVTAYKNGMVELYYEIRK